MHSNNIYIIITLLFALSCINQNKWKDVKTLTFKRQQSYNYSEMLSGKLDSTEKNELESFKKIVKNKNNEPNGENINITKDKKTIKERFSTFLSALSDLYNNFIDLFK